MPTAGGLLGKSEHIPRHGKKHSAYQEAGDGQWIIMPNGMKMAKEWKRVTLFQKAFVSSILIMDVTIPRWDLSQLHTERIH